MGKQLAGTMKKLLITVRQDTITEAARATIAFENEIRRLRQSGMTDVEIKQLLLEDFVSENPTLFGAYKNAVKEELAGAVHQADALGAVDTFGEDGDPEMIWTTVGDDASCEDCEGRAGRVEKLSIWKAIGLPKSGFSRCGRRCRC